MNMVTTSILSVTNEDQYHMNTPKHYIQAHQENNDTPVLNSARNIGYDTVKLHHQLPFDQ